MVKYLYQRVILNKVAGYAYNEENALVPTKELYGGKVISSSKPLTIDGKMYVGADSSGILYDYKNLVGQINFSETILVLGNVVPLCKSGLSIYEKMSGQGKELLHLQIEDGVLLPMLFFTDANENIWTKLIWEDPNSHEIKEGYAIYKNKRNNFANIYITGPKWNTVLTEGKVDKSKIEEIKNQPVFRRKMARATSIYSGPKFTGNTYSTTTGQLLNDGEYLEAIRTHSPLIIQNASKFPKASKETIYDYETNKYYTEWMYDYQLNYNKSGLKKDDFKKMYERINQDVRSIKKNWTQNVKYYNRFKLANPDDILTKGFCHIFFTRPDLNITSNGKLTGGPKRDPTFNYAFNRKKEIVEQLELSSDRKNDFMMLLSNKANSFELSDESLTTDQAGTTYLGHSVTFARHNIKSKAAGTFSINYVDNRDLDILLLHKLWIDYMSNVYRGVWNPRDKYIYGKILDYACSVYVIITAEDFETILYWAKYYGVFPVNVPYSGVSWSSGQVVSKVDYSVTYAYSWKDDFDPLTITELNMNAFRSKVPKKTQYIPQYSPNLGHAGYTWVEAPFVETIKFNNGANENGSKFSMKLRFKPSK